MAGREGLTQAETQILRGEKKISQRNQKKDSLQFVSSESCWKVNGLESKTEESNINDSSMSFIFLKHSLLQQDSDSFTSELQLT